MQERGLRAVNELNQLRHDLVGHSEVANGIKAYELAFRMQSAPLELLDLSGESKATLDTYGLSREEVTAAGKMGGHSSSARRMKSVGARPGSRCMCTTSTQASFTSSASITRS
jgi:hypothetical protein